VRDKSGRWCALRIRPYQGVDNRLDGAVLAAIDIEAMERHEEHLARSTGTAPAEAQRPGG
jgi:hypothetical protein